MELDTNEENLGMITTKRSITVFKPVLLAGVMSVGLLPAIGHATPSIAAARDASCGTTNFFPRIAANAIQVPRVHRLHLQVRQPVRHRWQWRHPQTQW